MPQRASPAFLAALRQRFGDQCSTALAVCEQHGRDESAYIDVPPPAAVVYAESSADVCAAVQLCAAHQVPLIPYGAGSSLEGQLLALHGGISLDLSRMNRVLAIYPDDLCATVQPGVTRMQLNAALRDQGLFFPIDPGADASLGGMAATRASGTNAVRYGTMRDNVLALEVVGASGVPARTGTRARKSSAGYDLTRLYVGSEGTLGVITELTLRLYPLPEAVAAAVCSFATLEAAVRSTIAIIQMGIPIARCELLDAATVRAVNAYAGLGLRAEALLLMEFHGSPAGVREQTELVQAICAEHQGSAFDWADTPEQRSRLWQARHHAYFAALQTRPGCRAITTDACVPISRLADCLLASVADAEASGLPYFLVGHVGDGNFHFGYLIDPHSAAERAQAEALNQRLVARALALGGTCSGEHGVGLHKIEFLQQEAGPEGIALMRALKQALDPQGIFNPGKVLL
ncbi:MAG: FAD-linked oxidase C-terminal domain-containing protein [Pseudomonadota bacterium]